MSPVTYQSKNSIVTNEKNRLTSTTGMRKNPPDNSAEACRMARKSLTTVITDDDMDDVIDEQEEINLNPGERSGSGNMAARRLLEIRREERELNSYLDDMFEY
jgi:hypothetical protein